MENRLLLLFWRFFLSSSHFVLGFHGIKYNCLVTDVHEYARPKR